jgi:hypothetical protein
MADRLALAQAAPDGLVPGALEILKAGQPASRWPWAVALPVDSLARQEAKDSSSVWEAPAQAWRPQVDA